MNTISAELYIGNRILAARQIREVSQESLARTLGVTRDQIDDYEQGRALLAAGQLHDVARALKVNVSFFYEGLNGTTACPYALSVENYALLRHAVQRIAADHEVTTAGHRKKLSRHQAINMAREVCEALGWSYGRGRSGQLALRAPATERVPDASGMR
jgi:transcriptional regulator with XRE-family HTH domain